MELTDEEKEYILTLLEKELHSHGDLGYTFISQLKRKIEE
ncbi:hypothetical protein VPHD249_0096 [Vibrio phage D249]|nr:hypothetical protein SIPHO036v1_90002 [Vibrio phage 70E38.1]QZI88167.1 hypothetical protein SIPHO035v1_p0076 [Vibrio phage 234P7B]QZI88536.1 hypothetical protein SIPHO037v1_p0095 [Vibrio phage 70E35.2]